MTLSEANASTPQWPSHVRSGSPPLSRSIGAALGALEPFDAAANPHLHLLGPQALS